MKPRRHFLSWLLWPHLLLITGILVSAYLGALPKTPLLAWQGCDKVMHFLLMGLTVLFLDLWLRGKNLPLKKLAIPVSFLLVSLLAAAEELIQSLSVTRTADPLDFLADLLGMGLAIWVSRKVLRPHPSAV